jgi:protein-S-isoprenylcysteine O-methyltransferase Ste14
MRRLMNLLAVVPHFSDRIRFTRWFVILLIPLLMVIEPARRPEWAGDLMEALGAVCLAICLVGRGWASLYVAGRKDRELVVLGPYSVVRNPLYVFSFVGIVGIGLISKMFTLLALLTIIFALYYRLVVRREEAQLALLHGDAAANYFARVPRWFPDFSNWRDTTRVEIEPRRIFATLADTSLFFLTFMFFGLFEFLRTASVVPIYLTLQ